MSLVDKFYRWDPLLHFKSLTCQSWVGCRPSGTPSWDPCHCWIPAWSLRSIGKGESDPDLPGRPIEVRDERRGGAPFGGFECLYVVVVLVVGREVGDQGKYEVCEKREMWRAREGYVNGGNYLYSPWWPPLSLSRTRGSGGETGGRAAPLTCKERAEGDMVRSYEVNWGDGDRGA